MVIVFAKGLWVKIEIGLHQALHLEASTLS